MFNVPMNDVGEIFVTVEFHAFAGWCMITKRVGFFHRLDIAFVRIIYSQIANNKMLILLLINDNVY